MTDATDLKATIKQHLERIEQLAINTISDASLLTTGNLAHHRAEIAANGRYTIDIAAEMRGIIEEL